MTRVSRGSAPCGLDLVVYGPRACPGRGCAAPFPNKGRQDFASQSCGLFNFDGLVRSPKRPFSVIPAEAGIQEYQGLLDPGFRRGDNLEDFLRSHQL